MDNTTAGERKLALTIYENAKNVKGRGAFATFDQLCAVMSKRHLRDEKDGKAFSPHRLNEGTTRANLNVEYLSMAVADVDDGVTLDELRPLISNYTWIATSSHRHTNEHAKFRLVFPLSRDVYPGEWGNFRAAFNKLLQNHIDPATKDAGRFYYLPSCSSSNWEFAFFEVNKGEWLDPDKLAPSDDSADLYTPTSINSSKSELSLFAGQEHPLSMIAEAANRCAQLGYFRDTGCSDDEMEPVWWACLGIAKHCRDGIEKAHEWSSLDSRYSAAETDRKMDKWTYGPTTCAKFQELNGTVCNGCTFKGTISSPIQLGRTMDTEPPLVVEEGEVIPKKLWFFPKGFEVVGDVLLMKIPGKEADDPPTIVKVASPWFYLKERIEAHDGTYSHMVTTEIRKNKWRDFEVQAKQMAELRSLKASFASYEVTVHQDKFFELYYKEWANELRKHKDEVRTFRQMGWNKNFTGFMVGDQMLTENGRSTIRVDRTFIKDDDLIECANVKGTKEEWTKGVMELYDRENGLPYQYTILTQFSSPLVAMMDYEEWNGIPLALTSDNSGYGKTTVTKIGINALMSSSKTTITNITPRAMILRAGQMNNTPLLYDELTRHLPDPDDLAGISYDLSNGRPRVGSEVGGREREAGLRFKFNSTITANKNFFEKLAQSKVTPIATQMRIFEIPMESYPMLDTVREGSKLHATHHELALHLVNNVHGVWADDYFRFVIQNKRDIRDKLHSTAMEIISHLGGNAAKERFYAYHVACVMVAGWICQKIGALHFDLREIRKWALHHIVMMRKSAQVYGPDVEELFSKMVGDLHGSILVTKHFDTLDTRANAIEVPMIPLRNAPQARLVLGAEKKERGKFFVSIRFLDEWCAKNNLTGSAFKRMLGGSGLLRPSAEKGRGFDRKINLAKGVPSHPTGQARCYEFDYDSVQGLLRDVVDGNVLNIRQPVANSVASDSEEVSKAGRGGGI